MLIEIAFSGSDRAHNDDAFDFRFDVFTWRDGDHLRTVIARVKGVTVLGLTRKFGRGDDKAGRAIVDRSCISAGLRRIESLGQALREAQETPQVIRIDDEIEVVQRERKHCSHQQRAGGDLFCNAAVDSSGDGPGRTTLHACETACDLPDTRLLCSNFVHLKMAVASTYPPALVAGPRTCELGKQDRVDKSPIQCVPGGHDCWRRVLDLSLGAEASPLPPLALNEALDFLSWVWRAKFPKSQTKLIHLASASAAAEVTHPCSSIDEFRSRMNALADLLDSIKIDAGLTSAPGKITGTLNCLQDVLAQNLGKPEIDQAEAGIGTLRNVVELRTGLHHSDAGKKAPAAARKLGFDWPPTDWKRAWERVRDQSARAVREIRQAIEATV